jgi:hypothetical protein
MNFQLPPPQQCPDIWPKFVEWLAVKMEQDRFVATDHVLPILDITFRGRSMTTCPFCGVTLKPRTEAAIAQRHP